MGGYQCDWPTHAHAQQQTILKSGASYVHKPLRGTVQTAMACSRAARLVKYGTSPPARWQVTPVLRRTELQQQSHGPLDCVRAGEKF